MMMMDAGGRYFTLMAEGIKVTFDLDVGHISSFAATRSGKPYSPFHRAPWVDEALEDTVPAHLRRLSIDFFCAPFGESDVETAPAHGWSANSPWMLVRSEQLEDGCQ